MSFIRRRFGISENKLFALVFSFLALGITIAEVVIGVVSAGRGFFTFSNIWHYFVLLLIYGLLCIYNLRNDNRAYSPIIMFLFSHFFSGSIDIFLFLYQLPGSYSVPNLIYIIATLAAVILAVFAFVYILQYMRFRSDAARRIQFFLIALAILLALPATFIFIYNVVNAPDGVAEWLLSLLFALSSCFAGIGCFFTFRRLIR